MNLNAARLHQPGGNEIELVVYTFKTIYIGQTKFLDQMQNKLE